MCIQTFDGKLCRAHYSWVQYVTLSNMTLNKNVFLKYVQIIKCAAVEVTVLSLENNKLRVAYLESKYCIELNKNKLKFNGNVQLLNLK